MKRSAVAACVMSIVGSTGQVSAPLGSSTDDIELYGKINNLLDSDPPATPNIISQTIYASSPFYDRTGRYYIGGVRARF